MSTITNIPKYNFEKSKTFSDFYEKKAQYRNPNFNTPDNNAGIIDRYVHVVKNNPKKFTIAGISALLLGGGGLILSKEKMGIKLREGLEHIKNNASSEIPTKGFEKAKELMIKTGAGIFNVDTQKNMLLLALVEKIPWLGKRLINASKYSLKATAGKAKSNYESWIKNITNIAGTIEKTITAKSGKLSEQELHIFNKLKINSKKLTQEESQIFSDSANLQELEKLRELQKLITETNLGNLAQKVKEGFHTGDGGRIKKLRDKIETENINKYKKEYFPKSLSWKDIKVACKNLIKGMFDRQLMRENWGETLSKVEESINKTNTKPNNIEQVIESLGKLQNSMIEIKNPSKDFKNITNKLKNDVIKGFTDAKEFELNKYAGREIDLAAGGGLPEVLIPLVTGGILTHNIVKDSEPGTRTDTFMQKGGLAFVGGLSAWGAISARYGVNGLPGIFAGILSGIALDQVGKRIYNFIKKDNTTEELRNKMQPQFPPLIVTEKA